MKPVEWVITLTLVFAATPAAWWSGDLLVYTLPLLIPFAHSVRRGEI